MVTRNEDIVRRAQIEILRELLGSHGADRASRAYVERVCDRARDLIGADFTAVLVRAPDGGFAWLGVAGNETNEIDRRKRALGRGPSVTALVEDRTVIFGASPMTARDGSVDGYHVLGAERTQTAMAIPLRGVGGTFGSLLFGWRRETVLTADDQDLAEALAEHIAVVLDSRQSHTESEHRRMEAEALAQLVREGASERQTERVIGLICEQAAKLSGADYAGVRLVGSDGLLAWAGMWGNRSDAWRYRPSMAGTGSGTAALRAGHTVISRVAEVRARGVELDPHSVRAAEDGVVVLGTPVAYRGRKLGALVLGWREEVTPSGEQIRIAEVLAGYAAAVIDNARAHDETERRRREAESLAELARQGAAAQDIEPVADLVCRTACELVGGEFAALITREANNAVRWLSVYGNRSPIWHEYRVTPGRGPAARSMAEARTVVFRRGSGEADGRLDGLAVMAAEGAETAMAVPLLRRDGPFGSLIIGWRRAETVSIDQRRLAEALSGYAAALLDNALSRSETERRRQEAEALAELMRQGAAEPDPEQAIGLVCERGCELLGADYVRVSIVEEGSRIWHGVSGPDGSWRTPSRGRGVGATATALTQGHAVVFEHLDENPDYSRFHTLEGGVTAIAAPFVGRRGLRGALHLGWRRAVTITESQIRLSEGLASYAAVILENARVHSALEERAEALAASEERFRKLSEELEERVVERTAELKAANSELEAFSYSVSHDLRAPLRSMDGFCQVLLEDYGDRLDETGKSYLHRVRAASQRLAELIDGLLGLARVTRVPLRREPVDLSAIAESILASLCESEPHRTVETAVEPRLRVRGDPRLLHAVLDNLLRNAWKFSAKHESARIEFGSMRIDGEQAFFVRDDGAGFDMAFSDKLFGAFQRLHGMSEFEGTGIGLATVQRIINRHGGRVWATGEIEKGATFYFTLGDRASPAAGRRS